MTAPVVAWAQPAATQDCSRWTNSAARSHAVELRADVEGATFSIDGDLVPMRCGPIHLPPGPHRFGVVTSEASGDVSYSLRPANDGATVFDFRVEKDTHTEVLPRIAAVGSAIMLLAGGSLTTLGIVLEDDSLLGGGIAAGALGAGMLAGGIAGWYAIETDYGATTPSSGREHGEQVEIPFEERATWHDVLLPVMGVGLLIGLAGIIPMAMSASAASDTAENEDFYRELLGGAGCDGENVPAEYIDRCAELARERDGQRDQMAVGATLVAFGGTTAVGALIGYLVGAATHGGGTLEPRVSPAVGLTSASVSFELGF